jgi:hypothetical protein
MRTIGRLANAIVAGIAHLIGVLASIVGIVVGIPIIVWGVSRCWSLVDSRHLTSFSNIGGILGLLFFGFMTLLAIGEWLDPFDLRDVPIQGGSGDMRTAEPDDLEDAGIFGGH